MGIKTIARRNKMLPLLSGNSKLKKKPINRPKTRWANAIDWHETARLDLEPNLTVWEIHCWLNLVKAMKLRKPPESVACALSMPGLQMRISIKYKYQRFKTVT